MQSEPGAIATGSQPSRPARWLTPNPVAIAPGSDSILKVFETNQLQAQVMLLLNTHYFAVRISYVFFGLHIFLLGYLILKSDYIPRILGILLIVASCGYLIDSFGNFISPAYANNETVFLIFVAIPALVSELSLTLWLLFKGGKGASNFSKNSTDRQRL